MAAEEPGAAGAGNDPPAAITETHVATVVFLGERVYKVKKPVRTGFLDFRTREARERACHREVELNRRLCPAVYEGVADVVGPDGRTCEHAVVMRRMPPGRRLSALATGGAPDDEVRDQLRTLARRLAVFHAGALRDATIDAAGRREAVASRWRGCLDGLAPFRGEVLAPAVLDAVTADAERFVAGRGPLLDDRIAHGRIVDGHGDLIADDVFCTADGPQPLDCLEFDDGLRHVDGLDDAAFLAMDLERLGRPELGELFLRAYADFAADPAPESLRHHYTAYRAVVRCLVACLRTAQGDAASAAVARRLLDIARAHLQAADVRLVLVGGLPGVGKSTVAGRLADATGMVLLASDRVRHEVLGAPDPGAPDPGAEGFGAGRYAEGGVGAVYDELLRRAEALLGRGETVVLDASWTDPARRAAALELAARAHARPVVLRCTAPAEVAADRIRRRAPGFSDATPEVAARMAAERGDEPWEGAVDVRTDGDPAATVRLALAAVRAA